MVKFGKLKSPMRDYVIDTDIYSINDNGNVTEDGREIDYDDLLIQMEYAGVLTPEQVEAEVQNFKEVL